MQLTINGEAHSFESPLTLSALIEQLGLKLELQKRMMPVLVVDHLEETPTEN